MLYDKKEMDDMLRWEATWISSLGSRSNIVVKSH